MEYTVQTLSKIAGISTRTLRYYDEIDLLKPARINSSGYRIYGSKEVNRLQQILFYRELGVSLEAIKDIVSAPNFDETAALRDHHKQLLIKKAQLELLIANVEKTIGQNEGSLHMSDQEKFEGFKKQQLDENEAQYGKEIREKYGKDTVEASNKKYMNMSQADHDAVTALADEFAALLAEAFKIGDPASDIAQKAADLHRQWLCYFWADGAYSKEAHYGLAQMYVDDERFTAHYDKEVPGTALFLRDVIKVYTGQ